MKKIITFTLLTFLSYSIVGASEGEYKKALNFGVGYGGSISFLKKTSATTAHQFGFHLYYDVNKSSGEDRTNSDCTRTNTHKFSRVGLFYGIRKYLKNSGTRYFVQPQVALLGEGQSSLYEQSSGCLSVSNPYTGDRSFVVGVGATGKIGIEHFLSKSISVEGVYGLNFDYLDLDLETDEKKKEISIRSESNLSVNMYF